MAVDRSFNSPWNHSIRCDNCKRIPPKFHLCYLYEWKKVYLCPSCLGKFQKVLDDWHVSESIKTKYINDYKIMHQRTQKGQ